MNSLTKVVVTRSQRAGLNFVTLLSKSCCKHDVPMRASVSFSVRTMSHDMSLELFLIHTLAYANTQQVKQAIEKTFQNVEVKGV